MKVTFIGHRKIKQTNKLIEKLTRIITDLIVNESADTFIFGSKSEFDILCHKIVTELMCKYDNVRRVYVRAEYEYIDKAYTKYLLNYYEDTFYPTEVHGAGEASYVKRNRVMIDMCEVLVTYFDEKYTPHTGTNSGTKTAVDYARRKKKRIINVFEK